MRTSKRAVVAIFAVVGAFFLVRHGRTALHASLPNDMPAGAHFVQTGYDLSHNQAEGDWVACGADPTQNTNFCRVTDALGHVVYQGNFLPLAGTTAVPAGLLRVASIKPEHLWVAGPSEGGPIPIIPLVNGTILVPAADSDALADRWRANPEELRTIEE